MPKVSIIVPTYNVEQYLCECMDSIVNQTLNDIEIICVDDGSTDNSGKILDEYAARDNRIKVIHKENGGYGKAMNVGLDNATGEYIGIVEPDDYIELDMYEILYNKTIQKNLDIVKADYYIFDTENKAKQPICKLINDAKYYNEIFSPTEYKKILWKFTTNWSGIFKNSFIKKYNIRHNESPGASYQDNGFFIQTMYQADSILFIDKPCYHYRQDNPNQSIRKKNNTYVIPFEYEFIDKLFDNSKKLNALSSEYFYRKYIALMWHMKSRLERSLWKEYLTYIAANLKKYIQQGKCNLDYFSDKEREELNYILTDIDKYIEKYFLISISIIIPIYNAEKHLKKCLDSVINQTLKDIEIICVEDCSTDGSLKTLRQYEKKDERIKVIALPQNIKQGGARNRALDIAKGEYITFVDADDYLEPTALEDLLIANKKYNPDIVVANVTNFSESVEHENICNNFENYYAKVNKETGNYKFIGDFTSYRSGPVAKLFKKSIIDKFNVRFPENLINEDEAFHWAYFANIEQVCFLNKTIYHRKIHENSTMFKRDISKERILDMAFILGIICNNLSKQKKLKKYQLQFLQFYSNNKQAVFSRCSKTNRKKAQKIFNRIEKKYYFLAGYNNRFETFFSIKNSGTHKILTIFGIRLKIKSKKLAERKRIENIEIQLNALSKNMNNLINEIKKVNDPKNELVQLLNQILRERENSAKN